MGCRASRVVAPTRVEVAAGGAASVEEDVAGVQARTEGQGGEGDGAWSDNEAGDGDEDDDDDEDSSEDDDSTMAPDTEADELDVTFEATVDDGSSKDGDEDTEADELFVTVRRRNIVTGARAMDKSKLVNPVRGTRGTLPWHNSPGHPVEVMASKRRGKLKGWEMSDRNSKTGKLVVELDDGRRSQFAFHPTELKSLSATLCAPWDDDMLVVWSLENVKRVFRTVFAETVSGLPLTFSEVFELFRKSGYGVFVVGGAIRDAALDLPPSEIKDIDIAFSCSSREVLGLARSHGWKTRGPSPFGLVQMGNVVPDTLYLEGKSINGVNNDKNPISDGPASIGIDLAEEAVYRDFSCNSLFYDPFNETVIDPTGKGLHDAMSRTLRIPVARERWDDWAKGNPTKLLRYWKFIARGYKPADRDTTEYIIAKARELGGASLGAFEVYMFTKLGFPNDEKRAQFVAAIRADMGQVWLDKLGLAVPLPAQAPGALMRKKKRLAQQRSKAKAANKGKAKGAGTGPSAKKKKKRSPSYMNVGAKVNSGATAARMKRAKSEPGGPTGVGAATAPPRKKAVSNKVGPAAAAAGKDKQRRFESKTSAYR